MFWAFVFAADMAAGFGVKPKKRLIAKREMVGNNSPNGMNINVMGFVDARL